MEQEFLDPTLKGNESMEEAIHQYYLEPTERNLTGVCMALRHRVRADGHLIFPADILTGEDGSQEFAFKTVELEENCTAVAAFTTQAAFEKAPPSPALSTFIHSVLQTVLQTEDVAGILLNPWGESLFLDKDLLALVLTPGMERFS